MAKKTRIMVNPGAGNAFTFSLWQFYKAIWHRNRNLNRTVYLLQCSNRKPGVNTWLCAVGEAGFVGLPHPFPLPRWKYFSRGSNKVQIHRFDEEQSASSVRLSRVIFGLEGRPWNVLGPIPNSVISALLFYDPHWCQLRKYYATVTRRIRLTKNLIGA